jgi:flavin reductase (DIM6/NTAB) family NADH-FMN oxidoreductase RutF
MAKIVTDLKGCLKPMPDILVSCRGKDGKNNALAVACACNCSMNPPMVMVGIVPSRYSYELVKETGVFVVNLVTEDLRTQYAYLGSKSGRDEDKLAKLGMKIGEGVKVNAPILLDCPVSIECTVVDSIITGTHEMFVGKVEYIHAKEELILENGSIDYSKINLLKFR